MKTTWILPALATAILLTGCGNRRDEDTARSTETTRPMTNRMEERDTPAEQRATTDRSTDRDGGVVSEAVEDGKEMASDAVENGKELASDVIEDGRELASDVAGGVKEHLTDGDGTYRTDEDGRVHDK